MKNPVLGQPLWIKQAASPGQFPWLDHDEQCDVAIIGAGAAGSLCAYKLTQAGADVVLVGEHPVGYGGTAASEGTVTYQMEGGLLNLSGHIGMDQAVRVFQLCAQAVDNLEQLCAEVAPAADYTRRPCLYYTTNDKNIHGLSDEYLARRHNDFAVELIDRQNALSMFSFPVQAGIYSPNLAAECNPYLLVHGLASAAVSGGARVYENTPVCCLCEEDNGVTLHTETGRTIKAQKVIMATGTGNAGVSRCQSMQRTAFTVVTAPVGDFAGWHDQALLCSDSSPALRLRTTPDRRIMISGLDCGLLDSQCRLAGIIPAEPLARRKYQELEDTLRQMFPGIRGIETEYRYASAYTTTPDSLPIIGPQEPGSPVYLNLCTGGNGLAFADISSNLLTALIQGGDCSDIAPFLPDR